MDRASLSLDGSGAHALNEAPSEAVTCINGEMVHETTSVGTIDPAPDYELGNITLRVGGRWHDQEPVWFSGQIDEVRVWNVARTAEEIRAGMLTELEGTEEGLVGYWKFNEEPGSRVTMDSSPGGNDFELVGTAELVTSGPF